MYKNIKFKILVPLLSFFLISSFFVSWYFPTKEKEILEKSFNEKIVNLTTNTAIGVGIGMGTGKLKVLKDIFALLKDDGELAYVTVYNKNGIKLAGLINDNCDSLPRSEFFEKKEPFIANRMMNFRSKIIYDEKDLGTINIGLKMENLNQSVNEVQKTGYVFAILQMLFGLIFAWVLAEWISKNIRKILYVLKEIESGNLNVDVRINEKNQDELGQLLRSLLSMKIALSKIVTGVVKNSVDLKGSVDDISSSLNEVSTESKSIKRASAEMRDVVKTTDELTLSSRKSMDELAVSSNFLANSINESKEILMAITEKCVEESNISINANAKMLELEIFINEFEKSFNDITDILEIISSFSKRTNLLALNASIEAAGAGEAGKGFAVVAREVKELSSQIKDSVEQIVEFIKTMEFKTEKSITSLSESKEIIEKYTLLSSGIEKEIRQQVVQFQDVSQSLSLNESKLQNANDVIVKVKNHMNNVTHKVTDVDEALERTAKNITSMNSNAKVLENKSKTLIDLLGQFRV